MSDLYGKSLMMQKNSLLVIYSIGLIAPFALSDMATGALIVLPLVVTIYGMSVAKKENVPFVRVHYRWMLRTVLATWGWIALILTIGFLIIFLADIPIPEVIDMDKAFDDPAYDDFWLYMVAIFLASTLIPTLWYCYRFIRGLSTLHRNRTPKGQPITS